MGCAWAHGYSFDLEEVKADCVEGGQTGRTNWQGQPTFLAAREVQRQPSMSPSSSSSSSRSALPDGTIKTPKTTAGIRTVPQLPTLRRLLVAWKLESPRSRPDDLVIATVDGKPVQERNVRRAFVQARKAAGFDGGEDRLSMHALRHSFASLLATDLELPVTTLAAIIGHTDAGFTLRTYARDARDTATVVADVLARANSAGVGS